MSFSKKITEFPNVEAKLQKPTKLSAFERQRAEAEAKRKREAAENAAAYEDFVKSFDQDDSRDDERAGDSNRFGGSGPPDRRPGFGIPHAGLGTGKRHFGMASGSTIKSGPGSLGPPPSSFGKKPHYNVAPSSHHRDRDRDDSRGRLGFDEPDTGRKTISKAFDASDDEEEVAGAGRAAERAISKPTLRLANLPPTTSPAFIKTLIPPTLTVENVQIIPPSGPGGTERKSLTAIVTLTAETPASDIEAAVSTLQNRYLGYGFYLSLHRHLSSAAISSTSLPTVTSTTPVAYPFGARKVTESVGTQPPQPIGYGRCYAPPTSYNTPGGPFARGAIMHVRIEPPKDIKKLRMIHKVIESVLEHGLEIEALLMSRPEVQREERWAWIWDARSEGGIWYRWRLWEIVTGFQASQNQGKYLPLFEGSHAWKMPDQSLAYEYTTRVDGFVSEPEYNSSDEEEYEDEPNRPEVVGGSNDKEDMFLNPMAKSKLAHLLARLPTSISKIRKGDIARVAAFAITHASKGSDEIVDMIVSNVERPLAFTSANPVFKQDSQGRDRRDSQSRDASPVAEDKAGGNESVDDSAARLIGLYVISDILSSSSTSGVRHAWRYRQLFETTLRDRKTFESLGTMADKLNWGRLRAEKWKRSVGLILSLWEGWCVFTTEAQEYFVQSFENPPQLAKKAEKEAEQQKKATGRWKSVTDGPASLPLSTKAPSRSASPDDLGGAQRLLETGETDGEVAYSFGTYSDDESDVDVDIDGEPIVAIEKPQPVTDRDGDVAMAHNGLQAKDGDRASVPDKNEGKAIARFQMETINAGPRKRMRAVDMFADSASEDGE
jgi:U2-associated protein SR140